MNTLESYFNRIFVINLDERADRWLHFTHEMAKIGVTKYERFRGYNRPIGDAKGSGNFGCTASHAALLHIIAHAKIPRALILEDDVEVIHKDFPAIWDAMVPRLPDEWDILYLGGHWGSAPLARISPNVLKVDTMLTTSSYGITGAMARRMAPHIYGVGPIDSLYGDFLKASNSYCIQPRLMCQYTNFSDLQDREMNNRMSMTDKYHESLMPHSYVGAYADYVPPPPRVSAGKVTNPSQHTK